MVHIHPVAYKQLPTFISGRHEPCTCQCQNKKPETNLQHNADKQKCTLSWTHEVISYAQLSVRLQPSVQLWHITLQAFPSATTFAEASRCTLNFSFLPWTLSIAFILVSEGKYSTPIPTAVQQYTEWQLNYNAHKHNQSSRMFYLCVTNCSL